MNGKIIRYFLFITLLWLITPSCSPTLKTQATVTYISDDWAHSNIKVIAILPVTAGEGLDGLRTFADEQIAARLAARFATIQFKDHQECQNLINAAGLASDYSDALQAYVQTSALDANLIRSICDACGADLLFISRLTLSSEMKYYGANSVLRQEINFYLQIWSPGAADIVWEANAAAISVETTFDKPAELEQLITNAVDALVEKIPDL